MSEMPDTFYPTFAFTIANGASLSGGVDLGGMAVARIVMPAQWTTAVLTVQASADGQTYSDLYDRYGTEYTIQAAAGRAIVIPVSELCAMRYIKLRSGTSGSAVNQAAERAITVIGRPV